MDDEQSGNIDPKGGFFRIWDITGSHKKHIRGLLPISKSTLYSLIAQGKFPKPIKLSARISVWAAASVREAIVALSTSEKENK